MIATNNIFKCPEDPIQTSFARLLKQEPHNPGANYGFKKVLIGYKILVRSLRIIHIIHHSQNLNKKLLNVLKVYGCMSMVVGPFGKDFEGCIMTLALLSRNSRQLWKIECKCYFCFLALWWPTTLMFSLSCFSGRHSQPFSRDFCGFLQYCINLRGCKNPQDLCVGWSMSTSLCLQYPRTWIFLLESNVLYLIKQGYWKKYWLAEGFGQQLNHLKKRMLPDVNKFYNSCC